MKKQVQSRPKRSHKLKNQHDLLHGNTPRSLHKYNPLRFPQIQILPDQITVDIPFTTDIYTAFNTAAVAGSANLVANSLLTIRSSPSTNGLPVYAKGFLENYSRYRVEASEISMLLVSRETTKGQFILVTPTLEPQTITTAANFSSFQQLPFTKCLALGPITSGSCITSVTHSIDLEKLVGPHYKTQDEYASTITSAAPGDPLTQVLWVFAFCNLDSNTVTTGGVSVLLRMVQRVTFYQPIRNANSN